MNFQDDTEYDNDYSELVNLGLIFGTPTIKGDGIEIVYRGKKIIITPTSIKKAIQPIPRIKKNIRYEVTPAYLITDGKSGVTVKKGEARDWLRKLKKYIDNTTPNKIIVEGVLYEVWDKETIRKKYFTQLVEYLKKYKIVNSDDPNSPEANEYFEKIFKVDPSSDKRYIGSIISWILSKRPEDLETQIFEYLNKFKKLLDANPGKYGAISKNLSKGKYTFDQFKDLVSKEFSLIGPSDNMSAAIRIKEKTGDFKIVGENKDYVCYLVDEFIEDPSSDELNQWGVNYGKKHFCFSGNVDWCVKYKPTFEDYNPPYYYFLRKADGKEFALMHINSAQLKDISDRPIDYDDYMKIKDIILPILKKEGMPNDQNYEDSDFKVIIQNLDNDEFMELFSNTSIPELFSHSLNIFDYIMVDRLVEVYGAETLSEGNGMDVSEASLISDVKRMVNVNSSEFYKLSPNTVNVLISNFGADENEIYAMNIVYLRNSRSNYDDRFDLIKNLIDNWVLPNEMVTSGRFNTTAFERAVMVSVPEVVEYFIKNTEVDVNTTTTYDDGMTPLMFVSSLDDYDNNIIFNLLINHPNIEVNKYMEEYDVQDRKWVGQTALDRTSNQPDKAKALREKGAKLYAELPNTNNGKPAPSK